MDTGVVTVGVDRKLKADTSPAGGIVNSHDCRRRHFTLSGGGGGDSSEQDDDEDCDEDACAEDDDDVDDDDDDDDIIDIVGDHSQHVVINDNMVQRNDYEHQRYF